MHDFPHHYVVGASAQTEGSVTLSSEGVQDIPSVPPVEFGGPGGEWSPESLLVAAVADCFVLSFRAIARASRMEWDGLSISVDGILDKVDGVTQFTGFHVNATLDVPADTSETKAQKLLEKAEHVCLITNSLKADSTLETSIRIAGN